MQTASGGLGAWASVERGVRPFALGGLAGSLATMVVHPADTVKVQQQLAGESGARAPARSSGLGKKGLLPTALRMRTNLPLPRPPDGV